MTILWWHWLVLGLLLALAEMATPGGFFIIFFGLAALIVGVLAASNLAGPLWMQLLLFSMLSVASLLMFRRKLINRFQPDPQAPAVDQLVGELATAIEELAAHGVGRVELRGSAWSARNATGVVLARGARCRVVRVDGLTLHVEPEGGR
jgi:membrane protein implicated in regulation of membrane protease activity